MFGVVFNDKIPDPNVNQFVNQGYNNIDFSPASNQPTRTFVQPQKQQQQPAAPQQYQQQPAQQQQQFQQQAGIRIIPIQVEGGRSSQNDQTVVMQR